MQKLVFAHEMQELEAQTAQELGISTQTMMEIAGRHVADAVVARISSDSSVAIVCGTGNNGGDGFVAARQLAALRYRVNVFVIGHPQRFKDDAKLNFQAIERLGDVNIAWLKDTNDLPEFAKQLQEVSVIVDAMLGTGIENDVRELVGSVIDIINATHSSVISVDLPSGIHADTGQIMGRAVWADETIAFGFAKYGHYLFPGAQFCGRVSVKDIGIPAVFAHDLTTHAWEAKDGPILLPQRRRYTHKGDYGHVVVFAGSQHSPGAAALTLKAALRAGAGLVSWATSEDVLAHHTTWPSEAMLRVQQKGEAVSAWIARALQDARAVVVGPGWTTSQARYEELRELLTQCEVPLCIDADALNLMSLHEEFWALIKAPVVLTPHPKEMARLAQMQVLQIQKDRRQVAEHFADQHALTVILKGAGTIVSGGGQTAVIAAGNPGMATAGTGDVLAGVVGGLLAQELDIFRAAQIAALVHAAAGDKAAEKMGEAGLIASDVIEQLGTVFAEWHR
jgi:ADP-dependent NAD(P)H-hydrate dehydratase / NAD(P)H-hydrate epimerase